MRIVALSVLTGACAVAAPHPGPGLADAVKDAFTTHLAASWNDFRICEVYSKSDGARAFVARSLGDSYLTGIESIDRKELFVSKEGASSELHLGVVALEYVDTDTAARMAERLPDPDSRFLEGTLVLTKYQALRRGRVVLIVYSESFLDEQLERFFERVDERLEQ